MKKSTKKIIEHVCTKTMGDTVLNRTAYSDINIVPKNPKFEFNNAVEVTFGFISYRVSDTIKGKVVDEEGNPIPFAAVTIKDTKKEAMTDANGLFSIYQKDEWSDLTLVAMSVGFESREIKINRSNYESFSSIILFTLKPQLTGKVVVVGYTAAKKKKPIPLLKQIFKDTAFKSFKIYPNPISSNSALYIEWKLKDFGYHSLQLFNQSGQLVFTNELYIDEKARLLTINTPMIPAGSYFLKITNKTTGRSFTEKLVVE